MSRVVYKLGVTKTAATLAEHGAGLLTGHIRYENGREYVLVQNGTAASATIADGLACKPVIGATTTGRTAVLKVVITTAISSPCAGANNTGAAIPGDHFFWLISKGRGYASSVAAVEDGIGISPAAGGAVIAAAAVAPCGYTITDMAGAGVSVLDNSVQWNCGVGGPAA